MEVLEGLNVLVCINGRKNKLRVYYLSWLRNKIVKGDDVVSIVAMAIVVLPWQCVVVVVMLIFRSDRWRAPDRDTGLFQWGSWTNVSTSKSVSGGFLILCLHNS
jgi:membrane glycosyltransferase